jgi:F-type H+-transporting ATPase subunit a
LGDHESGSWFSFFGHGREGWDLIPMTWIVIILLVAVSVIGTRRLSLRPRGLQNGLEYAVSSIAGLCEAVIGPRGRDFVPLVGSIFIFILVMNLFGLIPGMKAPTENWSTTAALAIVVFLAVQFYGFWVYVMHFLGEPLWLSPLMLPLHIISELARPLSLSLRLFGNISAKERLLFMLTVLSLPLLHLFKIGDAWLGLPIPMSLPIMLLAILMAIIQALIFALLTAIYLAGAVAGHEELESEG